jgi:hypothetical protein
VLDSASPECSRCRTAGAYVAVLRTEFDFQSRMLADYRSVRLIDSLHCQNPFLIIIQSVRLAGVQTFLPTSFQSNNVSSFHVWGNEFEDREAEVLRVMLPEQSISTVPGFFIPPPPTPLRALRLPAFRQDPDLAPSSI